MFCFEYKKEREREREYKKRKEKKKLKIYLIDFVNGRSQLLNNLIERGPLGFGAPANIHDIEYFLRAQLRLLEPVAVLELHYEQRNVNALVGPASVACRLPTSDAKTFFQFKIISEN